MAVFKWNDWQIRKGMKDIMKFRGEFILRNVAGNNLIVPLDSDTVDFNKMITLNETGTFLWECLSDGQTEDELLESMLSEYEVSKEKAQADIEKFIDSLRNSNILE